MGVEGEERDKANGMASPRGMQRDQPLCRAEDGKWKACQQAVAGGGPERHVGDGAKNRSTRRKEAATGKKKREEKEREEKEREEKEREEKEREEKEREEKERERRRREKRRR